MAAAAEDDPTRPLGEEDVPTVPRQSLIDRFLQVRGLERPKPSIMREATAHGRMAAATLARLPERTLWQSYTKRQHGERTAFARRAMRLPDDTYSDSADVYIPKKRPLTFIKVHKDADDVSRQFLYRTRCLFFEREVVDLPVRDLTENQAAYDEALDRVYASSDDYDVGGNPIDNTRTS